MFYGWCFNQTLSIYECSKKMCSFFLRRPKFDLPKLCLKLLEKCVLRSFLKCKNCPRCKKHSLVFNHAVKNCGLFNTSKFYQYGFQDPMFSQHASFKALLDYPYKIHFRDGKVRSLNFCLMLIYPLEEIKRAERLWD